ncbi:unnamed protein product [Alopecurus aequalis]
MRTDGIQGQSPVEQVRLVVPTTDDPTLPTLTFRVWVIGIIGCIILSFVSVLTCFRPNPVDIPGFAIILVCYSLGKFMAAMLPTRLVRVPGTKIMFSLNPGPFSIKEHILCWTIFTSGSGVPIATEVFAATRAYFRRSIHPATYFLLLFTTANLVYGFAGLFMKFFVNRSEMWWPEVLPNVTLFRTIHEKDERSQTWLSSRQFFFLIFVTSFAYYTIPGYFFPSISALSFVCWIWKRSITAQQLGSSINGLGIGSLGLDWSAATGFTGSPIMFPFFVIVNTMVGFILFMYIVVPFAYWTNSFKAKRFPIVSIGMYDVYGAKYNVSRILDESTFHFKQEGYENYSEPYLSITRVCSIGFGFASIGASLTDIVLSHGRSFWDQLTQSTEDTGIHDVHGQTMSKYRSIPTWWFVVLLLPMMGLSVFACEGFGNELQLPYWGVILAFLLVLLFIPPLASLRATVAQEPFTEILAHILIGYLCPGRPLANMVFELYSSRTLEFALGTLAYFKFGFYMKIPPREMFVAQVIGSLIATSLDFGMTWWIFSSVENICRPDLLPKGSMWTCPSVGVMYNNMVIWGLIGPRRMLYPGGVYSKLIYFFLFGAIAPIPVWILAHAFPEKKWIKLIIVPALFMAGSRIPPASAVNFISWFIIGFVFNYLVFRRRKEWWAKYSLIFSIALDTGVAAMAFLTTLALQMQGINGVDWWGSAVSDHCPLATCPTEPGVQAKGCPVTS